MDSLTQMVLGAAVGELCLGKKLGNKAMVWGAIAGTIPDLDIISNMWMEEIDSLAFHRGISHSLFFALTFSMFMAILAKNWYDRGWHNQKIARLAGIAFSVLFTALIVFVLGFILSATIGYPQAYPAMILPVLAGLYFIRRSILSYKTTYNLETDISYKAWYNFFFWTIFTHPILDCFTVYGTQLFAPFSNVRISFDNISVADPIYTLLLAGGLLMASIFSRGSLIRHRWMTAGFILSSGYMLLTMYNKHQISTVLEKTLKEEKIEYVRYMTSPTILNNVLWSATVESDTSFYIGQYSFFDKEARFKLKEIPKNYDLLAENTSHTMNTLKWFSNNYYTVLERNDGKLQVNDIRYGQFDISEDNHEDNYIFRFVIEPGADGYVLGEADGGPPPGREDQMFAKLWRRIKGI